MTNAQRAARDREIREKFRNGATTKEIAQDFKISVESAIRITKPVRKERYEKRFLQARALRDQGLSYRAIGAQLGVAGETIWQILNATKEGNA